MHKIICPVKYAPRIFHICMLRGEIKSNEWNKFTCFRWINQVCYLRRFFIFYWKNSIEHLPYFQELILIQRSKNWGPHEPPSPWQRLKYSNLEVQLHLNRYILVTVRCVFGCFRKIYWNTAKQFGCFRSSCRDKITKYLYSFILGG